MNLRHLSMILLATNIGLLGAIFVLFSRLNQPTQPASSLESPVYIPNTVTQIAVRKFNATNLLSELASRRFGWNAIESTNYALYIFNLRSVGCPEETVRDIIIADVAKLYAQRREDLRSESPPVPYWRTLRSGETLANANPEFAEAWQALEQEQSQLIQDLLGVDYLSEVAKFASGSAASHPVLSFLPPDKQAAVRSLLADSLRNGDVMESAAWSSSASGEVLDRLLDQQQEELAALLTPEERRVFELYTSSLAEQLRHELYGFEPSQAEFDEIYRLRKAYQQVLASTLESNPDLASDLRDSALLEAENALNLELSRVLGKERLAAYRKATDPDWQVLIDQMEVSAELASQVYDVKQQAALQKQTIEINPTLTLEQRKSALLAIRQETQNTLANVLGSGAYDQYRRLGGDWLADLDRTTLEAIPTAPPIVRPPPFPPPPLQPTDSKTIIREIIIPEPVPVFPPPPGPIRQ